MNNDLSSDSGYLLLVEDERVVQANNKRILERRGYHVRTAFTLAEARAVMAKEPPRAIVLDIQLPDGSGIDFLKEIRKTSNIPVLLLTAMGTPNDIIKGLESGGDDYLVKPYNLSVFIMRLTALIRRASLLPDELVLGPIKINPASGKAYLNGEDMTLQQKEFSLLQQFVQYPEQIISADTLYERTWGQKMLGQDNALKVTISKLRTKIAGSGYTIVASRGEGYCFERE